MVARSQWFQADLRLKQAKNMMGQIFGGVAMMAFGDLLQLPPVQRDSVCDPLPEKNTKKSDKTPAEEDVEDEKPDKKRTPAEHK